MRSVWAQLAAFVVLTFAITWSLWLASFRMGDNGLQPLVFLIGVFGPAFAAVLLTARLGGRAQVRALLHRILISDVGLRWYVFAITFMLAIKLATIGLYRVLTHEWPPFGAEPFVLLLIAIPVSTPVQSGEEVGWRGYALPRLADVIGLRAGSVILGLIWAVWHLPLFLTGATAQSGQSFPVYALGVVAMSVTFAWLYTNTRGSLLLMMLMHSAINQFSFMTQSAVPGATDPWSLHASRLSWISVALLWISAGYFLIRMPRRTRLS